jgi:hypothetical protein
MIKLNDERLRHAVQEAKSAIEQRLQKLDLVSSDIKQIERYLEESGVRERVEFAFCGGATSPPEEDYALASEDYEYVVWEPLCEKGRWRLMYLKTHRDGSFCVDDLPDINDYYLGSTLTGPYSFEGEPEVLDHRPLIETPAEIRLRASEALPDLLTMIASNIKVTRLA